MNNIDGMVQVSTSWVKQATEAYLSMRDERIRKERKEAIQKQMSRKLFPARTEEDALSRLYDDWGFPWDNKGAMWAEKAERLQKAADVSVGDMMYLDTAIASWLSEYSQRLSTSEGKCMPLTEAVG